MVFTGHLAEGPRTLHDFALAQRLGLAGLPDGVEVELTRSPASFVLRLATTGRGGGSGCFRAVDAFKQVEWDTARVACCRELLDRARLREPRLRGLWIVVAAKLPKALLRRGLGKACYGEMLDAASRAGAALAPHDCLPDCGTSEEAARVWRGLPGVVEGPLRWLPEVLPGPDPVLTWRV